MSASIPFRKIEIESDLSALLSDLQKLKSGDWCAHVNQADYQGGWTILALRCAKSHIDAHPILQTFALEGVSEWADLPILDSCDGIQQVLSQIRCPIKSVRLMRLEKGAEIAPHKDHGLGAEQGEARLHLPIQTSDKVLFQVAGESVPMAAGELWYINADATHSVSNQGQKDRVHLVIDCEVNDWLRERIEQ